jgi:hypothetical protein
VVASGQGKSSSPVTQPKGQGRFFLGSKSKSGPVQGPKESFWRRSQPSLATGAGKCQQPTSPPSPGLIFGRASPLGKPSSRQAHFILCCQ